MGYVTRGGEAAQERARPKGGDAGSPWTQHVAVRVAVRVAVGGAAKQPPLVRARAERPPFGDCGALDSYRP